MTSSFHLQRSFNADYCSIDGKGQNLFIGESELTANYFHGKSHIAIDIDVPVESVRCQFDSKKDFFLFLFTN